MCVTSEEHILNDLFLKIFIGYRRRSGIGSGQYIRGALDSSDMIFSVGLVNINHTVNFGQIPVSDGPIALGCIQ